MSAESLPTYTIDLTQDILNPELDFEIGLQNEDLKLGQKLNDKGANKYIFSSLNETLSAHSPSGGDWKETFSSEGNDFLRLDTQEWQYKNAEGKKSSLTESVRGTEEEARHLEIVGELFAQGWSVKEYIDKFSGNQVKEVYFADEKGKIFYKAFENDPNFTLELQTFSLEQYMDDDSDDYAFEGAAPQATILDLNPVLNPNKNSLTQAKAEVNFWDKLMGSEPKAETTETRLNIFDIFSPAPLVTETGTGPVSVQQPSVAVFPSWAEEGLGEVPALSPPRPLEQQSFFSLFSSPELPSEPRHLEIPPEPQQTAQDDPLPKPPQKVSGTLPIGFLTPSLLPTITKRETNPTLEPTPVEMGRAPVTEIITIVEAQQDLPEIPVMPLNLNIDIKEELVKGFIEEDAKPNQADDRKPADTMEQPAISLLIEQPNAEETPIMTNETKQAEEPTKITVIQETQAPEPEISIQDAIIEPVIQAPSIIHGPAKKPANLVSEPRAEIKKVGEERVQVENLPEEAIGIKLDRAAEASKTEVLPAVDEVDPEQAQVGDITSEFQNVNPQEKQKNVVKIKEIEVGDQVVEVARLDKQDEISLIIKAPEVVLPEKITLTPVLPASQPKKTLLIKAARTELKILNKPDEPVKVIAPKERIVVQPTKALEQKPVIVKKIEEIRAPDTIITNLPKPKLIKPIKPALKIANKPVIKEPVVKLISKIKALQSAPTSMVQGSDRSVRVSTKALGRDSAVSLSRPLPPLKPFIPIKPIEQKSTSIPSIIKDISTIKTPAAPRMFAASEQKSIIPTATYDTLKKTISMGVRQKHQNPRRILQTLENTIQRKSAYKQQRAGDYIEEEVLIEQEAITLAV